MNVQFFDREDESDPRNGETFSDTRDLAAFIDELRSRPPFFCELIGSNNYKLMVGIGGDTGCVQYSASDGTPPYLMAVDRNVSSDEEYMEFLASGTLTPVNRRYCLPLDVVKTLVASFVKGGGMSSLIDWEEI